MELIPLRATVTLGSDGLEAALSDGRRLHHPDAVAMAELLLAQGVDADGVHMPDWRAGDCAPSAGQKVAIMGRMREHPRPGDSTDIAASPGPTLNDAASSQVSNFDAAMALKEVTDIAIRVLGTDELAEHWLTHPALALDDRRPLDLLATAAGIQAVKDLLTRMEFGVYT